MIKLKTNCNDCIHKKVCKNVNNARYNMTKLKDMQYGSGPNDDYNWDTMMEHHNVIIEFSCPDFEKQKASIKTQEIPGGRFA